MYESRHLCIYIFSYSCMNPSTIQWQGARMTRNRVFKYTQYKPAPTERLDRLHVCIHAECFYWKNHAFMHDLMHFYMNFLVWPVVSLYFYIQHGHVHEDQRCHACRGTYMLINTRTFTHSSIASITDKTKLHTSWWARAHLLYVPELFFDVYMRAHVRTHAYQTIYSSCMDTFCKIARIVTSFACIQIHARAYIRTYISTSWQ